MNKKILIWCIAAGSLVLAGSGDSYAQQETSVRYNKADANGFVISVDADKSDVSSSLEDYFKTTFDSKSSSSKGFKVFRGVSWPEISSEKLDVYYDVSGKKGKSEVTMLVSKGYDNFISTQSDAPAAQAVMNFLAGMQTRVTEYAKSMAIAAANKEVEEAQKEYNKYAKKAEELNQEKEKLEKEIAGNQSRLAEREKELNKAKAKLDAAQQQ